jgi:putative hydrolase of HD superfamily
VNKRYVTLDEKRALEDQVRDLQFGQEIMALVEEFNAGNTLESRLSRDADQLDLILELKEQLDLGNPNAEEWLSYAIKRIHTATAQNLAQEILTTHSTDWWFDKKTDWWINGQGNLPKGG